MEYLIPLQHWFVTATLSEVMLATCILLLPVALWFLRD